MINALPFTKSEIKQSIADRFEKVVRHFGDRIAIRGNGIEITYQELDGLANRLAHSILFFTGIKPEPVLLIFGHEPGIAPAIMGVLKTGKTYVAVDPDLPPARIEQILSDLKARLIVTNNVHQQLATSVANGSCEVINLDQLDPGDAPLERSLPIRSDETCAVFYTSGTTGQPKGVERSHQFLLHRVWFETNDYHIQAGDIFSIIHHFSFGASQADIFNALLNGATLCLFDIKKNGLNGLASWINNERISFFHIPSDLFRQFLDQLTEYEFFPSLRQITPSGRLYKQDVLRIRKHVSDDCLLIQRLASTETGMITRIKINKEAEIKSDVVPVGYPIDDKEVTIVDEFGRPVAAGEVGEIVVKSAYLASGYWDQPEKSRKAFLADPYDNEKKIFHLGDLGRMNQEGCLELVGRKDAQAKIRGYRVEPGEVEAALLNIPGSKEAVVIVQEYKPGENRLIAYVTLNDPATFSIGRIRDELGRTLPEYMIPAIFILLENIPLTERNKIDYKALPQPGDTRPDLVEKYIAPETEAELVLTEIWSEVLHVKPIGRNDNFFELGGHSLTAAQITSKVSAYFDANIPLRTLMDAPTISKYVTAIAAITRNASQMDTRNLQQALRLLGY